MPEFRPLWNDDEDTPPWQVERREDEQSEWEPVEIFFENEAKAKAYADNQNLVYNPPEAEPPPVPPLEPDPDGVADAPVPEGGIKK